MRIQPFVVKHFGTNDRPTVEGNGFRGLELGHTREEAERFITWVNDRLRELVQYREDEA